MRFSPFPVNFALDLTLQFPLPHDRHVRWVIAMIIDMADIAGANLLAGSLRGKMGLARLLEAATSEPDSPSAVFLDFGKIEIATASYLRESVFALKTLMRAQQSNHYPAIANANQVVVDEVAEVARSTSDAIISCLLSSDGRVTAPNIIGRLDPKQEMTFNAVQAQREADANLLMKMYGVQEKTTRTTAWNNRLASLVSRGVLREFTRGRAKTYRPLFDEAG